MKLRALVFPRLAAAALVLACLAPHALAGAAQAFGFSSTLGGDRNVAMRLSATGTVTAVDALARLMAVRGPRGILVFRLDPKVDNVAGIRVGDAVQVDYVAAFVLSRRRGLPGLPRTAPRGESLADSYGRPVVFLCDVLEVDKDNLVIRVRNPAGDVGDFPVADRSALAGMRVGDRILASMNQAVAVGVTPLAR